MAVLGAKAENIGKSIKVRISEVNEESTVSEIC
jgi:hypothetical protein